MSTRVTSQRPSPRSRKVREPSASAPDVESETALLKGLTTAQRQALDDALRALLATLNP